MINEDKKECEKDTKSCKGLFGIPMLMVKENTSTGYLIAAIISLIGGINIFILGTVQDSYGHCLLGGIYICFSMIWYRDYKRKLKREEKSSSKEDGD